MTKYFEIKILEPRKDLFGDRPEKLDGYSCHPDRYRYTYASLEMQNRYSGIPLQVVGEEGVFNFVDGYCPKFWSRNEAWIVREVPTEEFRAKYKDKDRFERVEPPMSEEYLKKFYADEEDY